MMRLYIVFWLLHYFLLVVICQDTPPVIDISTLLQKQALDNTTPNNYELIVKDIDDAMKKWGFFYIRNFGIDEGFISELKEQSMLFFNYSAKYSIRRALNNSRGFADDEFTKQLLDCKEIFDMGHVPNPSLPYDHPENIVLDGYNQWPKDYSPRFREIVELYYEKCTILARLFISVISHNLLHDPDEIIPKAFEQHTSLFRLNYYPFNETILELNQDGDAIHESTTKLGISRHTDAGVLTLLLQDQPGLEVYSGSKQDNHDGIWIPVDPIPGTLTVNVGDMLQVWSNGRFKAAEHRVRHSSDTTRYTAAYFFNPDYDTKIEPLIYHSHQHDSNDVQAKYRPIEWGYFRRQRFLGDYADFGKEIQIEDYLIH